MNFLWVTLTVKNLDETLKFYQEFVGLKLGKRYKPNEKMEIAFLKDDKSNTQIELIYNEETTSVPVGGDYSLGFKAKSLEQMVKLAQEKNLTIASEIFQPNPNIKFFYILDPDGRKVQFVETI